MFYKLPCSCRCKSALGSHQRRWDAVLPRRKHLVGAGRSAVTCFGTKIETREEAHLDKEVVELGGALTAEREQVLHARVHLAELELAHAALHDNVGVLPPPRRRRCLVKRGEALREAFLLKQQLCQHVDVRGVHVGGVLYHVGLQKVDRPALLRGLSSSL